MQDNQSAKLVGTEIHFGEAVEERISLSVRFGLCLSFYPVDQDEYLAIVDSYFANYHGDRAALHEAAKQFALMRGGRSGRVAKQFYNEYVEAAQWRARAAALLAPRSSFDMIGLAAGGG